MTFDHEAALQSILPSLDQIKSVASDQQFHQFANSFPRLRIWFRFLHRIGVDKDALALIAAADSKIVETRVLVPLRLFHSAYIAMRTVVDICTSYTFYSSHDIEWDAVCSGRSRWESRARIIEWHVKHTPRFREFNKEFNLAQLLDRDYQELSSYVHGVPAEGLPILLPSNAMPFPNARLAELIEIAERIDRNLSLLLLGVFHEEIPILARSDFRAITLGIERKKMASVGIVIPSR